MFSKYLDIVKSSPLFKRIAGGAFWSIFGTASAKAIVLVAGIICANILGKNGYGELGIVRSTINLFIVFGTAGLGITATRHIAKYKKDNTEKVESIIGITTLFSLIMAIIITLSVFLFAEDIATNTLNNPELEPSIRFGSLILFTTILNGVYNGINSGFEQFKNIAINTLCSSTIEAILIIVGAYYWGVNGAVVGFGIGISSLMLLNFMTARKALGKIGGKISIFKINKEDLSILYKFTIPAALSSFLVAPAYWVVRTLLVRFKDYGELGIFEAAEQWRVIILFIPSALSNIVLPILSSYTDNKKDYKKALHINLLLNTGTAFVLAVIISACSRIIMNTYGGGFNDTMPLIILAFSTVFSSFASVVGVSIVSRGKMWTSLVFNASWGCMFIGFTYLFLRMGYGASGVAFALLLSYLIHSINQSIYLYFTTKE
ncbi:MAG: oligosaccharide flippase family protein [Bacteroidaceae bacterium]|nr:oligosaccharide flippase family protein [Bacteroidaceae bacterium]